MLAQGNDCMVSWYIMCGLDCAFLGVQALFCRLLWRYAFPAMFASNRMVMVGNHLSRTMIQPPARKYVVVKPSPFQSLRGSSPKVPKGVQRHGHGMHWRPWNWANNYHRHEFNRTLSMDTRYCSIDHHLEIYRAIHSHIYIHIHSYCFSQMNSLFCSHRYFNCAVLRRFTAPFSEPRFHKSAAESLGQETGGVNENRVEHPQKNDHQQFY